MELDVCPNCGHANPTQRALCSSCGSTLVEALERSMPAPSTRRLTRLLAPPSALELATKGLEPSTPRLGIITFQQKAMWTLTPTPVSEVQGIPQITPGNRTNLGAALDLLHGNCGARIVISDLDVNTGCSWEECLTRIKSEHRRKIRWAVIGIHEPGCSWNTQGHQAAYSPNLYTQSQYDAGLAKALLNVSHTILDTHHQNELIIILDTSGSMTEGHKWTAATNALGALVHELREDARRPLTRTLQRWL